MTKMEVVARASEEQQHTADGAAVCVDGDRVYVGAEDGKLKVYNHHTMELIQEVAAHEYSITDLLLLGASLFSSSADTTVKVWDSATLTLRTTTQPHEEAVRKMATNGVHVFAGDDKGDVRLYDVDGRCSGTHAMVEEVWALHAQEDLLYSVRDRGITISRLSDTSNKSSVVASIEGRAPMVVSGDYLVYGDASGMSLVVRENKTKGGKELGMLTGHQMIITAVAKCGEGRAVSSGYDNTLKLWDLKGMKELASCPLPGCAGALAVSEDGCIFATGSGGYVCKVKVG
ncbi:F-box/WD repeat-containing protein 7-like [Portunus trituberculatus]|uniref:F-box/WD repeat-containing protein 7-like n=1 Tax=Portunus trituberculatus TaxID=210409 RepID=UPI001E1D0118|nr:F-box/WD repeat-containing protein 7-like [Portunus trituberculatus]XP_045117079.1 F-box/WD repeat-containing protein 7-like [Portunus trituberculatus]